jgi:hypothetical protein
MGDRLRPEYAHPSCKTRDCDIDGAASVAVSPTLASVGKSAEACDFSWLRRRDDSHATPKSDA